MEYFRYLVDRLAEEGRSDILVYGGGGGSSCPRRSRNSRLRGPAHLLAGRRAAARARADDQPAHRGVRPRSGRGHPALPGGPGGGRPSGPGPVDHQDRGWHRRCGQADALTGRSGRRRPPVLGITGTGGSGKSSMTDELIRRFGSTRRTSSPSPSWPSTPPGAGAGAPPRGPHPHERHRRPNVYFRSLATRGSPRAARHFPLVLAACATAGFDLVIVETPGIGRATPRSPTSPMSPST